MKELEVGKVSVIIPAYKIEPDVLLVKEALKGINHEVIVEYDKYGEGKGLMLQRGFKRAVGTRIVWLDADMQIHPKYIVKYLHLKADIVIGSKTHPRFSKRWFVSFIGHMIIKLLFGLPFKDTQCGMKIFKRGVLDYDWKIRGFGHDVEVLVIASKRFRNLTVNEVSVDYTKANKSSVTMKSCVRTLMEMIWLKQSLIKYW